MACTIVYFKIRIFMDNKKIICYLAQFNIIFMHECNSIYVYRVLLWNHFFFGGLLSAGLISTAFRLLKNLSWNL